MTDTLGWRMKVGVLTPATNSVAQPEFDGMRPRGVTNQLMRVAIPETPIDSPDELSAVRQRIRDDIERSVDVVMGCLPAVVIMALGAETIWDDVMTAATLEAHLTRRAGVPVVLGWQACVAAIRKYGGVRRIGVLTPYMSAGDAQVRRFFTEEGFEVVNLLGLRSSSPLLMAHEPLDRLRRGVRDLDDPNIELIVQVGANLPFAAVAAEAERWLGKPVLSVNVCAYWYALRQFGIQDKIDGFGSLLASY